MHISTISQRLRLLARAIGLIGQATGRWTVIWIGLLAAQGLLPAAGVYLTKILVDRLAELAGHGGGLWPLAGPAAGLGAVLVLTQVLQGITRWVRTAQSEYLQDHVKALVHEQAARVDMAFYESPAYYDEMERANSQADKHSLTLLENLGSLVQHGVTIVAIAALIIPYGWWLPLLLIGSTLPALWAVVRHSRQHHRWWSDSTESRRRTQYYDWILTSRYHAPEVRLFGLSQHFRGQYAALRQVLRAGQLDLLRGQSLSQAGAGFFAFLATGAVMVWMGSRAMQGAASLGDLALFYQAFQQGQGLARTLLGNLGQIYASIQFLEHLFRFLDIQPATPPPARATAPPEPPYAIEIEDVDFAYPGSDHLALRGFSLSIPARQTVAIVGPNGAGKSTLIHLLCRFHSPLSGVIRFNGVDLQHWDHPTLLRQIAALFQYFVNYAGTLAETVAMGDPGGIKGGLDLSRVKKACEASGVTDMLDRLPAGYETKLDKRFSGGVDLSGGQWQRVALARAFFREAPILLLDEPTSYLDPWAEARWLDRFLTLAKDRTTVIVTHRLTTAMRADRICVMEEGRIVESGTHAELLLQGGLYAHSWEEQTGISMDVPAHRI
ncbi:MAG: ABC transporter ATP-binding protein [Rhodothermales bacterium]|nr:ABC transporter ATP-binding protein [Rhodothermales bacterium]